MRIYFGEALDTDAPFVAMVAIADDEASARQVMHQHEYEVEASGDDPRLDRNIWLKPERTRVDLLGEAAPGVAWGHVVSAECGPE